tara:strand:- start:3589 stop:3849 length:261 start_codon:yes stop_codon:yes gene_type:complete
MFKELKYLFFLIAIFFFLFFTIRFYFSDENFRNSYRSLSNVDENIKKSEKNLIFLKNNTEDIIEFVDYKKDKKIKRYNFFKLLYND